MSLRERCMEQWEQSETLWTFIMTFLSTDISISPAKMPDDPFPKSKILGGTNAWPVPPTLNFGGDSPPQVSAPDPKQLPYATTLNNYPKQLPYATTLCNYPKQLP